MRGKFLKVFFDYFRENKDEWLLLHKQGKYEYRNPDSCYVYRFETFRTRAEAIDFLENHIPKADRDEWTLFSSEVER